MNQRSHTLINSISNLVFKTLIFFIFLIETNWHKIIFLGSIIDYLPMFLSPYDEDSIEYMDNLFCNNMDKC
jgi:hypothetical protein